MKRNRIVKIKNLDRSIRISIALGLMILVGALHLWRVEANSTKATRALINSITVNDLGNSIIASDGSCTLREALGNANANIDATGGDCAPGSGADVINFSVTGTITLTATLGITDSLTINGPGAEQLTISGNNAVRVFTIAAQAGDVTFSNLTIANGRVVGASGTADTDASVGQGGAIFNESTGTLNLTNLTLRNNAALGGTGANRRFGYGGDAHGGAIYHRAGTLNIVSSTLESNVALGGTGGAIDTTAGAFDSGGLGGRGQGGAVFAGSAINITGNVFKKNSVGGGAGGNAVGRRGGRGGDGNGGAVYVLYAPLQISGSRMEENSAAGGYGGNASNGGCAGSGGSGNGAGIYINANSDAKVINTTIIGNRTLIGGIGGGPTDCSGGLPFQGSGGGVGLFYERYRSTGNLEVTDSQITNNIAVVSGFGGGIFTANGAAKITRSTIAGNLASRGGGLYINSGAVTIEASTFQGNEAAGFESSQSGGAIAISEGDLSISNSTISGNRVTTASAPGFVGRTALGGGIAHSANATLSLLHTTITGNTVSGGTEANSGGGIYSVFGDGVTTRNTIIAGNTVSGNGATGPDIGGLTLRGTYYPATLTSHGYTLVGNDSGVNITTATGDQIGTSAMPINPQLGPLANNGGPTQTHALLMGSPALDKGHSFGVLLDQRGRPRPYDSDQPPAQGGDLADIGAFEVQAPCAPITLNPMSLPGGFVGTSYAQTITSMGGAAPYQFTVSSGNLPSGLTLSLDGMLSGTLRPSGTYNFTIATTDNLGCIGSQSYTLEVTCQPAAATLNGSATIRPGDATIVTITFTGGAPPYSATLSNGGGTQTGNDPVLNFTVTPTATTTYTIASASEANGCVVTREGSATITVANDTTPPTIACPGNQVGVTNGASVAVNYPPPTVSDNYPGTTFACDPPAGASFALGARTVTCTATDAARLTATCSFTVTVRQPRPAVRDLINRVRALTPTPLTTAQANQLIGHLELANTRLEQGQTTQACAHLQNFVGAVNGLVSNRSLDAAQGQSLISYANKIKNAVGCADGPPSN